jgi:NAD+ synthase/NAD+ synthase (glutamine-hydrolysing)
MKIALAQINPIVGDFDYNFKKIKDFADQAAGRGCDLVVFPELAISGYPPRDLLEKKDFVAAGLACLQRLVDTLRGIGVICGVADINPADAGNPLFNSAVLFEDGRVLQKVAKRLLPTYDVFDECRYFEPGAVYRTVAYRGRRLGLTVCEDVWNDKDVFKHRIYPSDPVALLVENGAELIVNISASPFHAGKDAFRGRMLATIAGKYRLPLIFVNQVGGNDSLLFDGLSTAFAATGEVVARASDFVEDLVVYDLETGRGECHPAAASEVAAVHRALVMGTRDYVTKCGFAKAVVGLSGGIDSALTAAIAVEALGAGNVRGVFMPSRYTSRENFEDTARLAANLGIALNTVPIDGIFDQFLGRLASGFDPRAPGVTEQNIQARIRGTILMAYANRDGSLLMTTGNKSELAVGYCTLYGDMSGGLAVISDVPKTMVYELSRHFNHGREVIPARIIAKVPSAELAPGQTDQDDLPPYAVLDEILKAFVEDLKTVDEIAAMGYERDLVADVVGRIVRSEYKRHQAAPGLKVTSKAFGYGRRYPIAHGFRPGSAFA